MLSKQAIEEFQEIYFETFGGKLSFEEATVKAEGLLRLYKSVLKPSINRGSTDESTNNTSAIAQS